MKTAYLITIIWILLPFAIVSTICAIRLFLTNLRLEKQLDERIEFSINQGVQIMLLQEQIGIFERPSDEVLERLQKELEHEELIFMNTQ